MLILKSIWRKIFRKDKIQTYLDSGRIPWSEGYKEYRFGVLSRVVQDEDLLRRFARGDQLPDNHGTGLDERVVEYPWLLGCLGSSLGPLLDAGSVLNYPYLLEHSCLRERPLVLMTLAPEGYMAKKPNVSYMFGDLRRTLFRSGVFLDVVCISTLEHIGQDNTRLYTEDIRYRESQAESGLLAIREFHRILAPGGHLYLTVPFGRAQNLGWLQQYDSERLQAVADTFGARPVRRDFFRLDANGWQKSTEAESSSCEYYDVHSAAGPAPDRAAAARAVACFEFVKSA